MKLFIFLLIIASLYPYIQDNTNINKGNLQLVEIDLTSTDTSGSNKFNDYFEVVKVISLNTDSLPDISEVTSINYIDSSIVIFDRIYSSVKIFDMNGKYKYSIGRLGEGEGEFKSLTDLHVDKKNRTFWLFSGESGGVFIYNFDGNFIKKIPTPFYAHYMVPLCKSEIAFYVNFSNHKNSNQNNLVISNMDGDVVKLWAPYKNKSRIGFSNTGYISSNQDGVLLNKAFNDTIYQILPNKDIVPKYRLNYDISKSNEWETSPSIISFDFKDFRTWTILNSGFVETKSLLAFTLTEKMTNRKYYYFKNKKKIISERSFSSKSVIKLLNQSKSYDGDNLIATINSKSFISKRLQSPEILNYIKEENNDLFKKISLINEINDHLVIIYRPKSI